MSGLRGGMSGLRGGGDEFNPRSGAFPRGTPT